jgi:hypothetical protein
MVIAGMALKFCFYSPELTNPGAFKLSCLAISQDNFLVVRVSPFPAERIGTCLSFRLLALLVCPNFCRVRRRTPEFGHMFTISCHVAPVFCKSSGKSMSAVVVTDEVKESR